MHRYYRKKLLFGASLAVILNFISGCRVGPFKPHKSEAIVGAPITYTHDIEPLIEAKCLSCHGDKNMDIIALGSFGDVVEHSRAIDKAVNNRTMPPFLAEKGHQSYEDDMSLSDGELHLLNSWFATGMTEGREVSADAEVEANQPISKEIRADLVVDVLAANKDGFLPKQSLTDEYRCFVQDLNTGATGKYLTGFQAIPGNRKIVHHIVTYIMDDPEIAAKVAKFDGKDGRPGYQCFGGPLPDDFKDTMSAADIASKRPYWLAHWAPGMFGVSFPTGTGIYIETGSKIISQIHYYTSTAPGDVDRNSTLRLQLADHVERPARMLVLGTTGPDGMDYPEIVVEPGETKTYVGTHNLAPMVEKLMTKSGTVSKFSGIQIHSVNMHMHSIGASAKAWLEKKDSSEEVLVEIPQWDLHWQRDFFLTEPKVFSNAEAAVVTLGLSCTYNNTRDKTVRSGEGSNDEMCLDFSYMSLIPVSGSPAP